MCRCNPVHIAWFRRSMATLEATGHCHWAIIHIVLPHGDYDHQFWLKKGVVAFCNSCSKACAQKAQKQTFCVDRWWIVTIRADELSNAKNVTFATPPPGEILFDNKIESQVVTLSSSSTKNVTSSPKSSKSTQRTHLPFRSIKVQGNKSRKNKNAFKNES